MRGTAVVSRTCLVLSVACPGAAIGQERASTDSLGSVRFESSCPAGARDRFDRAVALVHHMTYPAARAAFSDIAREYPTCAMAHWGIAMTLFQPLWPTRPSEQDLRRGWEEVLKAQQAGGTTERERMFIAAAAAFFEPGVPDYWARIGRWADAMAALHSTYPDDPEAAAFHALALLATAPPSGGSDHHEAAAAVLETILREHPAHPGAVHYTIHASDVTGRERASLDVVESYDAIAPRNPHALHMPTHIFVRLGDWQRVIEGNTRAAEAALANPAGDRGQWVWDEYPHAIEYLVYAYLQIGDDSAALRVWTELEGTADLQPTFKTAFHLSSIPARYALERRAWGEAARLEARRHPGLDWDLFPWPEAVTWFARGIGAARSGSGDGARAAESRLAQLREAGAVSGEDLFTRQTEVLRLGVAAWLAHVEGNGASAVDLMQQAVALEAATPKHAVTPAPTLPAAELLGDLLLELNRPEEALAAYRASLDAEPNRFNSLAGAARAASLAGDSGAAAAYRSRLRAQATAGSPREELRKTAGSE
jgi:tetratricopeptide (TPR) repeat protein